MKAPGLQQGIYASMGESGIFGFPKDKCAQIIVRTICEFFRAYPESTIKEVRLTSLNNSTVELMRQALSEKNRNS